MSLEKRFQARYGKVLYRKNFSKDFREAIRGVDSITRVISKAAKEKEEEKKEEK